MVTARPPSARLSKCADELEEKGYSLIIDRTNETLFKVDPSSTVEKVNEERSYLRQLARRISTEDHNLHFFHHEEKDHWIVSTLPEEDAEKHIF